MARTHQKIEKGNKKSMTQERVMSFTGDVRSLDTVNFADAIAAYRSAFNNFQGIVARVRNTVRDVNNVWRGEGGLEFESDSKQVQLNLQDITDIWTEIGDALDKAREEYDEADREVSNLFSS